MLIGWWYSGYGRGGTSLDYAKPNLDNYRNQNCLSYLRLILWISARLGRHGRMRDPNRIAVEIATDKGTRDCEVSPSGIPGALRPEQEMGNYLPVELV